jgi:hypothetical protein
MTVDLNLFQARISSDTIVDMRHEIPWLQFTEHTQLYRLLFRKSFAEAVSMKTLENLMIGIARDSGTRIDKSRVDRLGNRMKFYFGTKVRKDLIEPLDLARVIGKEECRKFSKY